MQHFEHLGGDGLWLKLYCADVVALIIGCSMLMGIEPLFWKQDKHFFFNLNLKTGDQNI